MGWMILFAGVVAAAGWLWLYNRIQCKRAEAAYPPKGAFLSVEGIKLHYIRKGDGVPVVFLHGGVLTGNDFQQVIELASSRGYQAIAFDRPGYGHSERPRKEQATPAVQARLLHGALQQMNVRKPIMAAHSWSALLALTYALAYPDCLSGVVILAGAMYKEGYPAEHGDPISKLTVAPAAGWLFRNMVLRSPLGTALANASVTQTFAPEPVPAGYREAALALWLRPGQFLANREDILAFPPAAQEASQHYNQIRCPVVIAAGEDDPFGVKEQAVRLKSDIPHAKLLMFPGVAHMIPQNHPELVMQAVEALKNQEGEGPDRS